MPFTLNHCSASGNNTTQVTKTTSVCNMRGAATTCRYDLRGVPAPRLDPGVVATGHAAPGSTARLTRDA